MEIEINNKTYEINPDIRFGTSIALKKNPENEDNTIKFLREVLIPTPTGKEIYNFRDSDILRVFELYGEAKNEQLVEYKKKLSQ